MVYFIEAEGFFFLTVNKGRDFYKSASIENIKMKTLVKSCWVTEELEGRSAGSRGQDQGNRGERQSPVELRRDMHQEEAAPWKLQT